MKSINFEILQNSWPELAALGGFAEQYAYGDPAGSLVKLRSLAEFMVLRIYDQFDIPRPTQPNLNDLLNSDAFRSDIPRVVLTKFHILRTHGNKAAHGETFAAKTALWLLREAFDLARWFFITFDNGRVGDCPEYQEPPPTGPGAESKAKLKREKKAVLEKLAAQEAQMQDLLRELETMRTQAKAAEKKAEELQTLVHAGKGAADALHFDEATTRRRLIDSLLMAAGWNVSPSGTNTEEVTQEQKIQYQPTKTGIGYADYVLWDDNGKPLAVIEVKKTSKDSHIGRKQAALYANGLEKMYVQRPVIFYTNGFDIWIWDDAQGYPPRQLFGFYSKDSLQYLVNFQRKTKISLNSIEPSAEIAGRLYQLEAIKRVTEKFTDKHRKALIVQATGTGKTRVAISLTNVLLQANWVKRVLFLCDRRELRKQAKNAFETYLKEPLSIVGANTAKDRHKRIYLATYPGMMKIYQSFDAGFFDLIIADESHRSIYNRYRDIFYYFDCLQVGLTATPVDFIYRNTFRLFGCQEKDPTVYYPLERAVDEKWLVPHEVYTHTTQFLRRGIKYADLSDEQKQQLEEDGEDPGSFNFKNHEIDKKIYNKETNRIILRNLMENGIRDATGQHPGKTIIFARSHKHALLLAQLFNEMYPQYGGNFCQVIDNYDPKAEQLIDDFKGLGTNKDLTIAISVDMLDAGIDVLEIVNLVFAKPIRSKVKFWQMIGRGTRLCKHLFGLGKDKKIFLIFDHWGNFEYFDLKIKEAEPAATKSLMQKVFESRLALAETAMNKAELADFRMAVELIHADLAALPEESIAVCEKWKEKRIVSRPETLDQFAPATVAVLRNEMAPLMQWINIRRDKDALEFDLLVTNMEIEFLRKSSRFENFKDLLLNQINQLQMHPNPVKAKADWIKKVRSSEFWEAVTVAELETMRKELRGIMQYRLSSGGPAYDPKVVDITDGDIEYALYPTKLQVIDDMRAYRIRVEEVLLQLFAHNPTLQKIKAGQAVNEEDLKALTSLVLTQRPDVDLNKLMDFYEDTAPPLDFIIRTIIGMEPEAVRKRFTDFVQKHPQLSAKQIRFLSLLENHICKYGIIEVERLYEPPYTTLDSDGLDGVFSHESQINDLIAIIESFKPQNYGGTISP